MKKENKAIPLITCECGYNNQPNNVKRYGTCRGCGKVLDNKSKFEYEMVCKLHMWRNKKRGERI